MCRVFGKTFNTLFIFNSNCLNDPSYICFPSNFDFTNILSLLCITIAIKNQFSGRASRRLSPNDTNIIKFSLKHCYQQIYKKIKAIDSSSVWGKKLMVILEKMSIKI